MELVSKYQFETFAHEATIQVIKKEQFLFRQNSIGWHAYIIVKGEIVLFENCDEDVAKENTLTIALEKINKQKAKLTKHYYFEPAVQSNGQPLYLKSKLSMFQKTGDFFGELSLMGKPYRRLNAMAKEDSVLLELN